MHLPCCASIYLERARVYIIASAEGSGYTLGVFREPPARGALARRHAAEIKTWQGGAAVVLICGAQAILSPFRARALLRNFTVIGLPSALLLYPERVFAASLDLRWVREN